MARHSDRPEAHASHPCFESLEQRLLLTTVQGGEFFIYHNSQGEAVRLDVAGLSTDTVEIFAHEAGSATLLNMPGLLNGTTPVGWDDEPSESLSALHLLRPADPYSTAPFDQQQFTEIDNRHLNPPLPVWVEYGDYLPLVAEPDPALPFHWERVTHGSRAEIYGIYAVRTSDQMRVTASTLAPPYFQGPWMDRINTWGSSTLPLIDHNQPTNPPGPVSPPAGSGGVLVGAMHAPRYDQGRLVEYDRWLGVANNISIYSTPTGFFPGGDVPAGVTVSDDITEISSVTPLGTNVQSLAADAQGYISAVDSSAFEGWLVNDQANGDIGDDVLAIAGSPGGGLYVVDNTPFPIFTTNNREFTPESYAIAVDDTGPSSIFYAIDEINQQLISSTEAGVITKLGGLADSAALTAYTYTNIQGLDFHPVDDELWGIATLVDRDPSTDPAPASTGPFLVAINTNVDPAQNTNAVTQIAALNTPVAGNPLPWDPGAPPELRSITWNRTGTTLYGVTVTNQLVVINTTTGEYAPVGWAGDNNLTADLGVPAGESVVGLDFIGSTLYGLTADGDIFQVPNVNDAGTVTMLGNTGVFNLTGAAYDGNNPGRLYTIVKEGGIHRLTALPMYASLAGVNRGSGVATGIDVLVHAVQPTFAFTNVTALEYGGAPEELYGLATIVDLDPNAAPAPPGGRVLVTIDSGTGLTTQGPVLGGAGDLSTMAWDSVASVFHGLNPGDNRIYSINHTTGAAVAVSPAGPAFVGLEWVDLGLGGAPMLIGVTADSMYHIDTTTWATTLLGDTGRTDLSGLAFTAASPGYLWLTDNVDDDNDGTPDNYRLVSSTVTSRLMTANGQGVVSPNPVGLLLYAAQDTYIYDNVLALDFDANGVLYGVAEAVDLTDPTAAVGNGNSFVVTIDPNSGDITSAVQLQNVATLSTITFDDLNVMLGIDPATNTLVTLDPATGIETVGPATQPGIVGIDWLAGTLYAVTPTTLYSLDPVSGVATAVPMGMFTPGNVAGLAGGVDWTTAARDPILWVSNLIGDDYLLLKTYTDPSDALRIMDRVIIGGTLAGEINNPGQINVIETGYLWGGVNIGKNIEAVLTREGSGGIPVGPVLTFQGLFSGESIIQAGGTINFVDSRGGEVFRSSVEARYDDLVDPHGQMTFELEAYSGSWLGGDLVDYRNDAMPNAQFINRPRDQQTMMVSGWIPTLIPAPHEDMSAPFPDGDQGWVDWYAMPMLAGQTVTIYGYSREWEIDPATGMFVGPFVDPDEQLAGKEWEMLYGSLRLRLYNADGFWVDGLGWETNEDWGIMSWPAGAGTQKPITFTAPEAGVYYLMAEQLAEGSYGFYRIDITDNTVGGLGGVNVEGDYSSGPHTGTLPASFMDTVSVHNDGNLGGVVASGGLGITAHTVGRGDIVGIRGGSVGSSILSEGRIGGVSSSTGGLGGYISAGEVPMGMLEPLLEDAFIQNVSAAADLGGGSILATGSIGVIRAGGNIGGWLIHANYDWQTDQAGPPGRVDLIDIAGDWGPPPMGVPQLKRGPKGDIGFVNVGGDIYVNYGSWFGLLVETRLVNGETARLNDDGGGLLTVTPVPTTVTDAQGNSTTYTPTISYGYIGVDDDYNPGLGDGGVIANLRIDGPATMTTFGATQISHLDLSYTPGTGAPPAISIGGNAEVDIYNVTSDQPIGSINNETAGDLISGNLVGGAEGIWLAHGDLGPRVSRAGSMLHGALVAPISADVIIEPQYGWSNGRVNGLNVVGDLPLLSVGGYLCDLRVEGTLGGVTVNADNQRQPDEWHGVKGLVWSDTRIDYIDTGHGLADDGPTDLARAGIMSSLSIGTVYIGQTRREINGIIYGELNGSILATSDDTVAVVPGTVTVPALPGTAGTGNPWLPGDPAAPWGAGTPSDAWSPGATAQPTQPQPGQPAAQAPVLVPRAAIGQIIGTNGAQMTSIVATAGLDTFQPYHGIVSGQAGIGTINFSGAGAKIHGSEIVGDYIGEVVAEAGTLGIETSYITASNGPVSSPAIERVAAGGPGMVFVEISTNGGDIGIVEGLDPQSDITYYILDIIDPPTGLPAPNPVTGLPLRTKFISKFVSTDGIDLIRSRDMDSVYISAPGALDSATIARDLVNSYDPSPFATLILDPDGVPLSGDETPIVTEGGPGVLLGAIDRLSVGNDFTNNSFAVAGEFNLTVGGDFSNSILRLPGSAANLGMLDVAGNIDPAYRNTAAWSYGVVLAGDGAGGFGLPTTVDMGDSPQDVATVDVDGDLVLDLVVANRETGTVSVLLGNGDGSFDMHGTYAVGTTPVALDVGDLDGDGFVDVATANQGSDDVSVLLGHGDGTFADQMLLPVGQAPADVALAQMNDDDLSGDVTANDWLDILVAETGDNTVGVLLNDGAGGFNRTAYVVGIAPSAVAAGDLDGLNEPDLAVTNSADGTVSLLLGDGAGGYNAPAPLILGAIPVDLAIADLDGANGLDLVVVNQLGDSVTVLLEDGAGGYNPTYVAVGDAPTAVAIADLDGLNGLDLVVTNGNDNTVSVLLEDGTGTGTYTATTAMAGITPVGLAVGDVDGDAAADIVIADAGPGVTYTNEIEIQSVGRIGTVRSGGTVRVGIRTTGGPGVPSSDMEMLNVAMGFFGTLDVAGSLGTLESHADLGDNPAAPFPEVQVINIQEDLDNLRVVGTAGNPSNMYADINLGGTFGHIDIDGGFYGVLSALGDIEFFSVGGDFGGDPGVAIGNPLGVNLGTLEAFGDIGFMSLANADQLAADIISGGAIQNLTFIGNDVQGDITSRHGEIMGITVINGDLIGAVTGTAVRNVTVVNGSVRGDITATDGDVVNVAVTSPGGVNDGLMANVVANNGRARAVRVYNGQLGDPQQDHVVSGTAGIGTLQVINGNLNADVDSGGRVDLLSVINGDIQGVRNPVRISADGGYRNVTVVGNVNNAVLRSGAKIDLLSVVGNVTGTTVSTGWDVGTASITGSFTNSSLLVGNDVGNGVGSVLAGDGGGGFGAATPVDMGQTPRDVALGDFNHDNILDLVVANRDVGTVSVLLGNGDGSFGVHRMFPVGTTPVAVAVGDLDGDGHSDLAVANQGSNDVSVLLGVGDGTFAAQAPQAVGQAPCDVILAQMNDDDLSGGVNNSDWLDILTADRTDNTVTVLLNDGAGGYNATPYNVGTAPSAIAAAQLDGANDPDIVAANSGDATVSLLLSDGAGGYLAAPPVGVGNNPSALAIANLDGLNQLDLVVANQDDDTITVLLEDGAGGYNATPLPVGVGPTALAVGDLDGLNQLDIAVVNGGDGTISVLLEDGAGGYTTTPFAAGTAPTGLAIGDLDGDTAAEIITANPGGGANPFNNGLPHSGNVNFLSVGTWDTSTAALGVTAGTDGLWVTPDDVEAPGTSTIKGLSIRNFVNPGGSFFVTDTEMGTWVRAPLDAEPGLVPGVNIRPVGASITNVLDGAGPADFGPEIGWQPYSAPVNDGTLTISLHGAGRANYDPATDILTLERTETSSSLLINYTGTVPHTITRIVGSDDSPLVSLTTVGNVAIADIGNPDGSDPIDGPVTSLYLTHVADNATWTLPGGVTSAVLPATNNLNAKVGNVISWTALGPQTGGSLTADALVSYTALGDTTADVTAGLGAATSIYVAGDYGGNLRTFLNASSAFIAGDFTGGAVFERGDVYSFGVLNDFTGAAEVERGKLYAAGVYAGSFGLAPDDGTSLRASAGINVFTTARDFYGLLSTNGDLMTVVVPRVMGGKLRARGDITYAMFGSMDTAIATAGGDFDIAYILGDMFGSSIYSGFDPGDAGFDPARGGESANVQIDFFTPAGWRTDGNADRALGGDIRMVYILGEVGRQEVPGVGFNYAGSTISAAVGPGADGYIGTGDDVVGGTGTLGRVTVTEGIYDDGVAGASYGFYGASNTPTVTAWHGDPFGANGNVSVGTIPATVGQLQVTDVRVLPRSVEVMFSSPVNAGTVNNARNDANRPTTFNLIASTDDIFGNGDDVSVADSVANTLAYDGTIQVVSMTLDGSADWSSLNVGTHWQLVISSPEVTDIRGKALDGEYDAVRGLPSGDRRPGGDFIYEYEYGQKVLSTVPGYVNNHGDAPTAAGMIIGYYDGMPQFSDLIPGTATVQTADVNDIIASAGVDNDSDGEPDLGTGHVPDYALYEGVDDSGMAMAYRDLSDPAVAAGSPIQPHANDSLADFMQTSFSYVDGGLGTHVYGQSANPYIAQGVEAFVTFQSAGAYVATTQINGFGGMTWDDYTAEINADRPVMLQVETTGDIFNPNYQWVVGVGYDAGTQQYAAFDTNVRAVQWFTWADAGLNNPYGITDSITVQMA